MHTTRRDLAKNAACSAFITAVTASLLAPAPVWAQKTVVVSVNSIGEQGNVDSFRGAVSDDGRYVAFQSNSTNLIDLDGDGVIDPDANTTLADDIFVHDRVTGTTELVSVNSAGVQANSGAPLNHTTRGAHHPDMSADGRYVTFSSDATNLADRDGDGVFDDDANGTSDIFVHDRVTGTTELVSVNSQGVQGNMSSFRSRISPDGRYVVFSSAATNLIDLDGDGIIDVDSNGTVQDVFLRDRVSGTTELISVGATGVQGNSYSLAAGAISADGRVVAFTSQSTNLVDGDANDTADVFVRDRVAGTTELVSINNAGQQTNNGSGGYHGVDISRDGRFVAFHSSATNLVDTNLDGIIEPDGSWIANDVFVHDRITHTTEIVSVNSLGVQGGLFLSSANPSLSADGRLVAFRSRQPNLVDLNGDRMPDPGWNRSDFHIFVRDRIAGITKMASVNSIRAPGNGDSHAPALSGNGRFVVFGSESTNLVENDGDNLFDDDATPFRVDFYWHDRNPTPPELVVTSPQRNATVPEGSVRIEGRVTDEDGVRRVTVDGAVADLVATGNPDDPNEAAFAVTLVLSEGFQTLVISATDVYGVSTLIQTSVIVEPDIRQCDTNRDGSVDRADIAAIFAARGQAATGPGDPRDVNEDGLVTINDGRLCVLQCTNPGCAPNPAD